jgi:hypothetical protein
MARFDENVEIIGGSLILKERTALAPVSDLISLPEKVRVHIQAENDTVKIFNGDEKPTLSFNSRDAILDVGGHSVEGDIRVYDREGRVRVHINGHDGSIRVRDTSSIDRIRLGTDVDSVTIFDGEGHQAFRLNSRHAVLDVGGRWVGPVDPVGRDDRTGIKGVEGDIRVYDGEGEVRVHIDGHDGSIRFRDTSPTIAVEFDIEDGSMLDEGTVMVIRDDGKLTPCDKANDQKVIGVLLPAHAPQGIVLGHKASVGGRRAVAIAGKVECWVDAVGAPIALGDLLITSETKGFAQKIFEFVNVGTRLGKALKAVTGGQEKIPILLTLS